VLGLGERGGGGCERAQQGALLVQEPKVGLLPNSLVLHTKKRIWYNLSLSPSNHYKTRDEGAATVELDQRVVRLLWRSWWWFGGVFK
jgi:hypothetical protein